jgi:hypothetical protein
MKTAPSKHDDLYENHGIAGGFYDNLARLQELPYHVLECLCGKTFNGHSWQDAGEGLDQHLMVLVKNHINEVE